MALAERLGKTLWELDHTMPIEEMFLWDAFMKWRERQQDNG